MQITNIKQLSRKITGHWATVQWDDVGKRDGLIVEICTDGRITKNSCISVFDPGRCDIEHVSADQIVAVGGRVTIPYFG